jgi:hypothetical protein
LRHETGENSWSGRYEEDAGSLPVCFRKTPERDAVYAGGPFICRYWWTIS